MAKKNNPEQDEAEQALAERVDNQMEDDSVVRWVALMSLEGMTVKEIRDKLLSDRLVSKTMSEDRIRNICARAMATRGDLKHLVQAKAEMTDQTWLRLDSYLRRKRVIEMMEQVVGSAMGEAQTVSQLNQVSFMLAGIAKVQDQMDAFTGSKAPPVTVVAHVSYDPLEQMRRVVQEEVRGRVIEIEPEVIVTDNWPQNDPDEGFGEEE